ncbi:MAG: hypothetical protein IH905_10850 [Proteobacteria bacterium]|nr:hypothetical protein [Pseudomonadota bacterium]
MTEEARKIRLVMELRKSGITNTQVLSAIERVPRERFVLPSFVDQAYENTALPIDQGQTISQPFVVAFMTQTLEVGPRTRVLEIGTGSGYQAAVVAELKKIRDVCNRHRLVMHLDGARLFNALVETGEKPSQHGELFDTVSVCLSKGLGAPVGSLLIGSKEMIKKARWVRKVFGGGMRQAGFLAAAGIYALENNIDRLKDDHRRARTIGDALQEAAFVSEVMPIDTNIIIFSLKEGYTTEQILARLADKNVLALPFGPNEIRMITHLDFIDEMLEHTVQVLKTIR